MGKLCATLNGSGLQVHRVRCPFEDDVTALRTLPIGAANKVRAHATGGWRRTPFSTDPEVAAYFRFLPLPRFPRGRLRAGFATGARARALSALGGVS